MVSPPAMAVVYAFSVLFLCCCPQLFGAATDAQASPWGLERLSATAFFPAVLLTLVLTPLLSFAHVRADGDRRLVTDLAKGTVVAATVALACAAVLLAADGIVVQLGADGHLDRGRGDVARLNIK